MSRFTEGLGREEEDGLGWEGLVPTKAERELEALEKRVEAHNRNYEWHEQNKAYLAAARARVLAMPLPRNECPGCFMAIYEGAAKDGWCTDCNPNNRIDSGNDRG